MRRTRCWKLVAAAIACIGAEATPPTAPPAEETVILVHGLGRSSRSMKSMARYLSGHGFRAVNLDYPSTEKPPEELVADVAAALRACCAEAPQVHFVTHSLGGILVRAYLAGQPLPNLGRVVMLAPPNHGSELVDTFGDSSLFRWALGPTAEELGTDGDSFPNRLPAPAYEVGIIAGTDSINPVGSAVIPGESDGTVSLRSTQLAGMSDFLAVPYSHTFIMDAKEVQAQVAHFLGQGSFARSAPESE